MTIPPGPAVVIDTMVVSSMINAARDPATASEYRSLIADRPIIISFMTVTELRYGAIRAGWGELRRRGLERDLAGLTIAQSTRRSPPGHLPRLIFWPRAKPKLEE